MLFLYLINKILLQILIDKYKLIDNFKVKDTSIRRGIF